MERGSSGERGGLRRGGFSHLVRGLLLLWGFEFSENV